MEKKSKNTALARKLKAIEKILSDPTYDKYLEPLELRIDAIRKVLLEIDRTAVLRVGKK